MGTTGRNWSGWFLGGYLVLFYAYLFAPLLVMAAAAFNAYPYPSVTQWDGFTLAWFGALARDQRMLQGLGNSLLVGGGVVLVAVPLGLAGALVLHRLDSRWNGLLYALMVSPILTPGIILGIGGLVFWRAFGVPGGLFVATMAQASFIAAYAMLLVAARLQRLDPALGEAALDLGASHALVLRRITLPFLAPTLWAAAALGFLQSIENYNTTVFAIGGQWTLVTEIGSRLRFGLSPVINVVGVLFIAVTVLASLGWALLRRRERHAAA